MPGQKHEQIINTIRRIVSVEYASQWPNTKLAIGQMASLMAGALEDRKPLTPDLVIIPPDGFGGMVVEVGQMPDGKWGHVFCERDGRPVRVLRVGFDLSVSIIHQRDTEAERYLCRLLETRFAEVEL